MLLISLHVKNFAIINEAEVIFGDKLNILTGETGAGKSIIIGSINAALGAKVNKDIIRSGAEYALIELIFETKDETVFDIMRRQDIPIEGNQIIISRKIMANRSICRINGENVTSSVLAEIAGRLIDIHGQHEHQSLLHKAKHLELVDRYARDDIYKIKQELEQCYKEYIRIKQEFEEAGIDEDKRAREMSFLEYELNEITAAALVQGEDDELAERYKKLSNANTISEGLQSVYRFIGYEPSAAGDLIGRALRQLTKLTEYDSSITTFLNQLSDIDALVNDLNRDLAEYLQDMDNPEEELNEVSQRLDIINRLKAKYGNSIERILAYKKECEEKLEKYRNYDNYISKLAEKLKRYEEKLQALSEKLSSVRQSKARELSARIREALVALNFLDVKFEMAFERLDHYTANGFDDAEFIISTNPGEELKPLSKIASGGELSRIMLGIKSVLAGKDEIETLIFDEIDTGISGRTAQKVSEQLAVLSRDHQIICITHLAQIAAMADSHYVIEKQTDGMTTHTDIKKLNEDEMIDELSRILGGVQITARVRESAKEMKELAVATKKSYYKNQK